MRSAKIQVSYRKRKGGDTMNKTELEVEMLRKGFSTPVLANKIGINKKTLYSKMRGETSFNQREILAIKKTLELDNERIFDIFFEDNVS